MPSASSIDVLVIGAGPAGLATSRELARGGVAHLVCERGDRIAHAWHNLYDGLVLHTGKHLSALPGMPFPPPTPLFPTRQQFLDYLHRYVDAFRLPIATSTEIASLDRNGAAWLARRADGTTLRARAIVIATGILSNPYTPEIPNAERFRGQLMHSVEYRRPEGFAGRRVLVVGAGNSAGEISVELARAGARVTVAVRSGARVVPRDVLGVPIQYLAAALSRLPRGAQRRIADWIARAGELSRGPAVLPRPDDSDCPDVPLIGFHMVDAIRAGAIRLRGGIAELTPDGARFGDGSEDAFDTIMLATGYRAAISAFGNVVRQDHCGFALRRSRIVSVDQPDLYFVGHNYDVRGGLRNIAIDARRVGRLINGEEVRGHAGSTPPR